MNTKPRHRRLAPVLFAAWATAMAAGTACSDGAANGAPSTATPVVEAGPDSEARGDGAVRLNTGGPLTAPFECRTDGIYGEPMTEPDIVEALRAKAQLDSFEIRAVLARGADAGSVEGRGAAQAGTRCATAADKTACETAVAALRSAQEESLYRSTHEADANASLGGLARPAGYFVIHTRGDVVGKVSNLTELRALYPAVTSPAEAILFAHAGGYRVECHTASGWLREEPDGFILLASSGHEGRCTRNDVVLLVKRDGSTEVKDILHGVRDSCT